ncbi:MAG: dihydrolipoyl dehydrogenase [Bdellovibrionales bacterium]|nr:dihydrolipoyl dehydrogenase [Bdellovibrionales bacterium]NQZ18336.1 dihydrolipoyl dehydrogenase [Bdellovibrionales bacterium]
MSQFDVCVIGAGPGGYVAAIRCAQLGMKTVVVEREKLGGVCLNVGCIPSKAMIGASHMLHRMQHDASEMGLEFSGPVKVNMKKLKDWKQSVSDRMSGGVEGLLKGNKVDIVAGDAEFVSANELKVKGSDSTKSIQAKNFIVATGSRPIEIPGFEFDEKTVMSSTGALDLDKLPKSVLVIGGGYIGLEIGSYLAKLGTQVDILEAGEALLKGVVEKDVAQVVARKLKKDGVNVHLKAMAKSYKKSGSSCEVTADVKGESKKFKAEKILVTVGRKPNSDEMNLKGIGVDIDERGFLKTDPQRRTNIPNIYAIGDIACQPMLAHKASHEGVMVAEILGGKNRVYDAKTVPAVMFTDPEIASAGMLEAEAKAAGYSDLKIAKFPFAANGKAVSMMETDGFVKMIADAKTNVVLGVHIVGPEASNLISEAALAIEMGATLEDIALTIHPHPTLGETMMEAAEATLGHAIHVIQKKRT